MVMAEGSCSKGRGFESQGHMVDGHFFTFVCCKNCNVRLKRRKRCRGWPIKILKEGDFENESQIQNRHFQENNCSQLHKRVVSAGPRRATASARTPFSRKIINLFGENWWTGFDKRVP